MNDLTTIWKPMGDGLRLKLKGHPIMIRRMVERKGEHCFTIVIEDAYEKGVYYLLATAKADAARVAMELEELAGR